MRRNGVGHGRYVRSDLDDSVERILGEGSEHFAHALIQNRVSPIRSDIIQWHENETAILEPGMGEDQVLRRNL